MAFRIYALRRLVSDRLRRSADMKGLREVYTTRDYLDAYRKHTDARVEDDPHAAVGGLWEQMGALQLEFLVKIGLTKEHCLLDIGCGTLRGGRHFIAYLDTGNYTGIDISPRAIQYGLQLVHVEHLSEKQPRLLVNNDLELRFSEFENETFDYLLAQSVFTHLRPKDIETCFENIGRIMHDRSIFCFTFREAKKYTQTGFKSFRYPFTFFQKMAERKGFTIQDHSHKYAHPRGQRMVLATKKV